MAHAYKRKTVNYKYQNLKIYSYKFETELDYVSKHRFHRSDT